MFPLCIFPVGLGGQCFPGKSFYPVQSSLPATLDQKQSREPGWYQSLAALSLGCDRALLLSRSPGTSPASAVPSVAKAWSPPPWQTKMGRSTAKVSPTFPAGLSWALRGAGEGPCAGTQGGTEAGEGVAQQLHSGTGCASHGAGEFPAEPGPPCLPNESGKPCPVLSRQGVPLGEDLLLCQPHLCLPSILCRLLRQELRSQGLWLRAGRRGTDPLAVSSRAGPCTRPGLVLCCPPAPRRSECPTATPSHRCFAAPAPPALPQRSLEPGGSQHCPHGVLLGQVARGGPLPRAAARPQCPSPAPRCPSRRPRAQL